MTDTHKVTITLTRSQQMALIDMLIEYVRTPDHTEQFINVSTDEVTTPGELLRLISEAGAP